jgi:hypothetical protein
MLICLGDESILGLHDFQIMPLKPGWREYRFAWSGSLIFYVLCIKLHGSIRNNHYAIGRRLEDFADTCWRTQLLGLWFE